MLLPTIADLFTNVKGPIERSGDEYVITSISITSVDV